MSQPADPAGLGLGLGTFPTRYSPGSLLRVRVITPPAGYLGLGFYYSPGLLLRVRVTTPPARYLGLVLGLQLPWLVT